jgi:phosphoinositide-3-kinase regulatory subunit 4
LEKFQCREVYRPGGGEDKHPRNYDPWPVDDDKPEGMLERFATTHDLTTSNASSQGACAMVTGTDAYEDGRELKYGYILSGGSDRKLRFWDTADAKHSAILSGLEADDPRPVYTVSRPTTGLIINVERLPRPQPTAPNAAAGSSRSSSSNSKGQDKKASRPTVMTLHQQLLLRTHLDAITDVALLESPYGMTISVDRSGCTYVFQ